MFTKCGTYLWLIPKYQQHIKAREPFINISGAMNVLLVKHH